MAKDGDTLFAFSLQALGPWASAHLYLAHMGEKAIAAKQVGSLLWLQYG